MITWIIFHSHPATLSYIYYTTFEEDNNHTQVKHPPNLPMECLLINTTKDQYYTLLHIPLYNCHQVPYKSTWRISTIVTQKPNGEEKKRINNHVPLNQPHYEYKQETHPQSTPNKPL